MPDRMKTDDYFSITKAVKARIPKLPFRDMKVLILGKKYSLSLVFGSGRLLKKLNRIYRRQNRVTDILSFSLSPKEGEIFINPKQAGKESRWFGETKTNFISHLFSSG